MEAELANLIDAIPPAKAEGGADAAGCDTPAAPAVAESAGAADAQPAAAQMPAGSGSERKCRKCYKQPVTSGYCKDCNKISVQICRTFGGLPAEFKKLSEDEKARFYANNAGQSQDGLVKAMDEVLEKIKENADGQLGDFKPLGVWATLGYDAKAIEANATPENVEWNKSMGAWTYRVLIHRTRSDDIARRTSTANVGNFARRQVKRRRSEESTGGGGGDGTGGGEVATPNAKPEAKPKPKPKVGPSKEALRRVAGGILGKVTPALIGITGDLKDPLANKVHPNIKKDAEAAKAKLEAIKADAEKAMSAPDPLKMIPCQLSKEAPALLKPHMDNIALFASMLTTLRQQDKKQYV